MSAARGQDQLDEIEEILEKGSGSAAGTERWMISYADFVTLLLAFFIVMFAVSQVNKAKVAGFEQSVVTAFGGRKGVSQAAPPQGRAPFHHLPSPVPLVAVPPELARAIRQQERDMLAMERELRAALLPMINARQITVAMRPKGVSIVMNASVLFANGSAELRPEAVKIVDAVGAILKHFPYQITVNGFTNKMPIRTAKYPSNWYLSAARAISVVNRFMADGIDPNRMAACGYGKYHPAVPYSLETMRDAMVKNRRVIIMVNGKEDDVLKYLERMVDASRGGEM